jgi:hypothetical protein
MHFEFQLCRLDPGKLHSSGTAGQSPSFEVRSDVRSNGLKQIDEAASLRSAWGRGAFRPRECMEKVL